MTSFSFSKSRAKVLCVFLFTLSLLTHSTSALSAETEGAVDPQNNPYFVTLLQIGLRKEQVPQFKELLGEYAQDREEAIQEALDGRDGNLEARIRREKGKVRKDFFAKMDKLLDDDQFSRFPPFHDELDKLLLERESLDEYIDPEGLLPGQT